MTSVARTATALTAFLLTGALQAAPASEEGDESERRQYTYAWMFTPDDEMRPRGGTTTGPDVKPDPSPGPAWKALQEPSLSSKERDRRAILALAGKYRATFDFIETIGFTEDYTPQRPYQSWATERVRVIANEPDFISLQHILVMSFEQEDGSISEPHVTKHWRQDWRYEDRDLHVYAGRSTWEHERLSKNRVEGSWSQAVYQVDDSPRYEAIGQWEHHDSHSTWTSEETWRPLPRREFSVRDDYDVLAGINRITVTRSGWVHEQDNLKLALDEDPESKGSYLARETGLIRYARIIEDFSAGDEYWKRTAPFWRLVREAWAAIYADSEQFSVSKRVDGDPLFMRMFELADRFGDGENTDENAVRAAVGKALDRYVQ